MKLCQKKISQIHLGFTSLHIGAYFLYLFSNVRKLLEDNKNLFPPKKRFVNARNTQNPSVKVSFSVQDVS